MQTIKVINQINEAVKVEIEGVGVVRQIEIAEKMFALNLIDYKSLRSAQRIALTHDLLSNAINSYNLYPKQF